MRTAACLSALRARGAAGEGGRIPDRASATVPCPGVPSRTREIRQGGGKGVSRRHLCGTLKQKQAPLVEEPAYLLSKIGRDDWIRTSDPLTPSQVRYQAAPHPETYPEPIRTSLPSASPGRPASREMPFLAPFSAATVLSPLAPAGQQVGPCHRREAPCAATRRVLLLQAASTARRGSTGGHLARVRSARVRPRRGCRAPQTSRPPRPQGHPPPAARPPAGAERRRASILRRTRAA